LARDVGHYGKNHNKVIADFIESKLWTFIKIFDKIILW
jgi:hypothetical protein